MELTAEDKEEVKAFASENTLEDRMTKLCSTWIGRLLCDKEIKSAMMLQAVGAPENAFGHRTGIHILLAGDPGTAKTLLLHSMSEILPGSRYIDASGATAAGVTASAEQIEDFYTGKTRWGLRPGVIALTPKDSVCSLDELNLYKGDLGDIHTALESGKITKTTGPVKGTLRADCSILAGANPMDGDNKKFIKGRPFTKQIGMTIPLLQRFDLIFVLLDRANKATDEAIAMSILGYGENLTTDKTVDFVQKYIAMAKTIQPKFTKEAAEYISKSHSRKRSKQGDYIRSHRLVPALQRLALATARFDFSEEVTIAHVRYAEDVCAKSLNEKDPGASQGANDEETLQKNKDVTKYVTEFMESKSTTGRNHPTPQPELKEYLKTKGISFNNDGDLRSALDKVSNLHKNNNGWLYLNMEE
jgi:DNA replicative helicase MCM subunit Mcm2 (Cdc46/Mcm family)